jgi:hypothetical protein
MTELSASFHVRKHEFGSCILAFKEILKRLSVVVLPVTTASPIASAAEQQQEHDDNQKHVHKISSN